VSAAMDEDLFPLERPPRPSADSLSSFRTLPPLVPEPRVRQGLLVKQGAVAPMHRARWPGMRGGEACGVGGMIDFEMAWWLGRGLARGCCYPFPSALHARGAPFAGGMAGAKRGEVREAGGGGACPCALGCCEEKLARDDAAKALAALVVGRRCGETRHWRVSST
jgi:hypothetical protein